MSNSNELPTTNEAHDGFVWSQVKHVTYAIVLAGMIAFAAAAPALAAGGVGFGK